MHRRKTSTLSQLTYDSTLVHGSFRQVGMQNDNETDETFNAPIHLDKPLSSCYSFLDRIRRKAVDIAGIDWILLTSVSVSMSVISFVVDFFVEKIRNTIVHTYKATDKIYLRYLIWTGIPMTCILFSAGIVEKFARQAAGSGIPEIRTIMSGVVLNEYLTARTAAVKTIALIAALGSGVPIGKMGPFVHTSSAVTTIIGNFLSGKDNDLSEKRFVYNDMLVIACAVGVAATFNAPIGGVLFSIELTSNYFAIRNYWRGFYASLLGAIVFRGISLIRDESSTLLPVQFLKFHTEHPFAPAEIIAYIILGVYSGIFGAMFTLLHKKIVIFERQIKLKISFGVRKMVYTTIVSLIIFTTTFPYSIGKFMGKEHSIDVKLRHLLSFGIWNGDMASQWTEIQEIWSHNSTFSYLAIFFSVNFILTILASTLPIPIGLYAPLFLLGGTFGRLFGELLVILFPDGVRYAKTNISKPIIPAGYALAGAAALSGSATHTLSIAVIAIEMTGEILYLLPIMICVTAANMVSRKLHISVYDTIVRLKKLPYLPGIHQYGYKINQIPHNVKEFMNSKFNVLHNGLSTSDINKLLIVDRSKYFPIVEDVDSMVLIGLINRYQVLQILKKSPGFCACANDNLLLKPFYVPMDKRKTQNERKSSKIQDRQSICSRFTITEVIESNFQYQETLKGLDGVPITLNECSNLLEAHVIFQLLHLEAVAVTEHGRIIGIITNKEINDGIKRFL
ncbi:hypothetical protein GJ496_000946 [Pomphorhynchus laevis]|nr:hypothetical protein GJ496_000946 [Pomphorhynchus laevis]